MTNEPSSVARTSWAAPAQADPAEQPLHDILNSALGHADVFTDLFVRQAIYDPKQHSALSVILEAPERLMPKWGRRIQCMIHEQFNYSLVNPNTAICHKLNSLH